MLKGFYMSFPTPFPKRRLRFAAQLALHAAACAGLAGAVHVDERFGDSERRDQRPPESLAWFTSQQAAVQEVAPGMLRLMPPNPEQSMHLVGHVGPAGTAVTLERGKPLRLEVEFTPVRLGAGTRHGLRVGLFHSGSTAPFGRDGENGDVEYTGYAVSVNPQADSAPALDLYRRMTGQRGRLLTNNRAFERFGRGGGALMLREGERYRLTLELQLARGDNVRMRVTLDGPGLRGVTLTANSPAVTTRFDTIGLSFYQTIGELQIHRIQLAD